MNGQTRKTAVITGASGGIGAASARRLAQEGFDVVLGARRAEELRVVAEGCGGRALPLDVTDAVSVAAFAAEIDHVSLLVNNAGLAAGMDTLAEMPLDRLRIMWETNVLGLVAVTQALLPKLIESSGHIINIGSTAGRDSYPRGGGYTATKHAVRSLTKTLRIELLGQPVRVSEVAPGLVRTDFSMVRFEGDRVKAEKPYEGITPLTAEDIADVIAWISTRPPHVNVDEVVVRPLAQATSTDIARGKGL